jgi:hypothetical protein
LPFWGIPHFQTNPFQLCHSVFHLHFWRRSFKQCQAGWSSGLVVILYCTG